MLYEAGELAPAESSRFEGHLEGCPSCQAELRRVRDAHSMGKALLVEPSPELLAAVFSAQGRSVTTVSGVADWLLRALPAAAVTAVLAIVSALDKPRRAPSWETDLTDRVLRLDDRRQAITDEFKTFDSLRGTP